MTDRYDTSEPEDQYESGSDGMVLKNLLGITTCEAMGIAETEALWAGLDCDYRPMAKLFEAVIERSS